MPKVNKNYLKSSKCSEMSSLLRSKNFWLKKMSTFLAGDKNARRLMTPGRSNWTKSLTCTLRQSLQSLASLSNCGIGNENMPYFWSLYKSLKNTIITYLFFKATLWFSMSSWLLPTTLWKYQSNVFPQGIWFPLFHQQFCVKSYDLRQLPIPNLSSGTSFSSYQLIWLSSLIKNLILILLNNWNSIFSKFNHNFSSLAQNSLIPATQSWGKVRSSILLNLSISKWPRFKKLKCKNIMDSFCFKFLFFVSKNVFLAWILLKKKKRCGS